MSTLDLITIGRVSVDLYGEQIGTRLEDVATFMKGVGGCAANVAIGAARLGLKAALISRVGNEPMGRFVVEQLAREGVVGSCVRIDPQRLTSLVLLAVRDEQTFPLVFYRDNCADGALGEEDIDPAFVLSAAAVLVTGTHFSIPGGARAQRKAMQLARSHGNKVILDIDYRPNLWGLGGHDTGGNRYAPSTRVTAELAAVLPECDLIVGTEEELHIAAGVESTLEAVRRIRAISRAVIVCKRGAAGCVLFPDEIPARLEDGMVCPGYTISVFNVLGAGDAFLAGFLRGYLSGESLESSARYANACGAIAVSRLLCSSEFPTWPELQHYLAHASVHRTLRDDLSLNHLHWVTTRPQAAEELLVFAVDHRTQLEELARRVGAPLERITALKVLAVEAAQGVAAGRRGFGILLDGTYGRPALARARQTGLWLGRPIERAGSRPLEFEGLPSVATELSEWPTDLTVKCLCLYHPDDPVALRSSQERELLRLASACRSQRRELLLEIIVSRHGQMLEDTVARALARIYELGIRPDWWKLEPQASVPAWTACSEVIRQHDPYCRGIVVLGLDAPLESLSRALQAGAAQHWVRGFAVGRTIFADAAEAWLAGRISDERAIEDMTERFAVLASSWNRARQMRRDTL